MVKIAPKCPKLSQTISNIPVIPLFWRSPVHRHLASVAHGEVVQHLDKLRVRQSAHIATVDLREKIEIFEIFRGLGLELSEPRRLCRLPADLGIDPAEECFSRVGLKTQKFFKNVKFFNHSC